MIRSACARPPAGRLLPSLLSVLLLALAGPAGARVIYVNANSPGTEHDGMSWPGAYTSIRDAIDAATDGDEVWVATPAPAAASYHESLVVNKAIGLYGGFAGSETLRSQRNWRAHPTKIAFDQFMAAALTCAASGVMIDGFTILGPANGVTVTSGAATIRNNRITGDSYTGVQVEASALATITNNTIYRVSNAIVVLGDATVRNNTLADNPYAVTVRSGQARLTNNILAFNMMAFWPDANIPVFSNNCVCASTGSDPLGVGPSSRRDCFSLDPLFADRAAGDYRLISDSPCIDRGLDTDVAPDETDGYGKPRIIGSHVDIGADESDGSVLPPTPRIWRVAPSGDDAADGLTWQTAKRTVAGALAGAWWKDEIWVCEGTYSESRHDIPSGVALYGGFSGVETQRGQRSWKEHPTIMDWGDGRHVIFEANFQDCVVDGFTLQNGAEGIYVRVGPLTAANNVIVGHYSMGVMGEAGAPVTLENNTIAHNRVGAWIQGPARLIGNNITDNAEDGVRLSEGEHVLSQNSIRRNGIGVVLNGTAVVESNVIADNTVYGAYAYSGTATFTGNTIASCPYGLAILDGAASLTNNVLAYNTYTPILRFGAGSIPVCAHNDFYTAPPRAGYVPPPDQGNLTVDPLFVDATGGNYRLTAASPCVDAGSDAAVGTGDLDADGKPRISGAHVDMGAYEYDGSAAPYTMAEAIGALKVAAGLKALAPVDAARLNVAAPDTPAVDLLDVIGLIRLAMEQDTAQ